MTMISPLCSVKTFKKGTIIIGKKVTVQPFSVIKAVEGIVSIGDNVFVNRNCIINAHDRISIGKGTTIGPGTYIFDHDHDGKGGFITGPITIGNNVWIGSGCIILKGISIGDNSIIGAGTLITKDVSADTLVINKRTTVERTLKDD